MSKHEIIQVNGEPCVLVPMEDMAVKNGLCRYCPHYSRSYEHCGLDVPTMRNKAFPCDEKATKLKLEGTDYGWYFIRVADLVDARSSGVYAPKGDRSE